MVKAPGKGSFGDDPFDKTPDWLANMIRKSKGNKLDGFGLLDSMFQEEEVVRTDRFDRQQFKEIREQAESLRNLIDKRSGTDEQWFDLIKDEYLGLFKGNPRTNKQGDMKPTHRINHNVMGKAMSTREWEELRTYTQLDEWAAVMAAVAFGGKLEQMFEENKELQEQQKRIQEQQQSVEDLIKELQDAQNPDELIDQLEQDLQDLQDALDQADQASNTSAMRKAMRDALGDTRQDMQDMEQAVTAFGTDPGELQRMSANERMELAARIQNAHKLRELAEKVGRMVPLALGENARKIVYGRDEIHDVEMGDDIGRLLASELMLLGNPKTKKIFYQKFAEKDLLQYQLRGTEKAARGAIICMIDTSGSMGGARETWAKAVGIALLNIAFKQNRDFYGILFSSNHDPLKEFYFPKGLASTNQVLDFAEYFYGGGTDFQKPITRAVDVLKKQFEDESANKGDLVMITDGECAVSEEWLDRYMNAKQEYAFRLYSCLIGVHSNTLDVLSDVTYNITEFANDGGAKDIFGYV